MTDCLAMSMLGAWAYQASLSADYVGMRYRGAVPWQAWVFACRKVPPNPRISS